MKNTPQAKGTIWVDLSKLNFTKRLVESSIFLFSVRHIHIFTDTVSYVEQGLFSITLSHKEL